MISAAELKTRQQEKLDAQREATLAIIERSLIESADAGHTSFTYHLTTEETLADSIISTLKDLGYGVRANDAKTSFLISWEDA